ncbi:MAG: glycosyltransferase, partial [Deltaproteobacteria bacterium]|nr:glycosyltransferase [Deltaproteobacteria bacterium]
FELVRAFARIAGHHPRARLLLVGQAHPREERLLKAEIAALGLDRLVHQVGELPRAQLPACLSACGGFVFPSYNEGSPRSVIEAMACGLPIVASRIPGIEALDPKADFIQFVERGEVEGLAAALDLLLAHPDQTRLRGECGRRHFLEHHTPRAASQPLVDLYRLLDERSVCQPIRSMTSR